MFQFLNKPYPAPEYNPKNSWIAVVIGLFIALVLILVEPFGIDNLKTDYKALKIGGYGLVTFIVVAFFNVLIPKLLPDYFTDKNWVVYKEILALLAMLTTIGLCNTLYSEIVLSDSPGLPGMLLLIGQTFVLGVIPIGFMVGLDHRRLFNKYEAQSKALHPQSKNVEAKREIPEILLIGENEGEKLQLDLTQLLFLESSANYVSIAYEIDGVLEKKLFRSSLSNMQKQLVSHNGVIRCHRSYIINLNRVTAVSGNAQGFQLSLPLFVETIPVSRKYVNEIRNWFS